MTWAWKVELPPTPKLVLMALADEANDNGYCVPTLGHLAKKCSINERSVRRMIRVLTAGRYLVVQPRFHNRARTSNGYQLAVDHPRTHRPGGQVAEVRGDGTALPGGSGHGRPEPPDTVVRATTDNTFVSSNPLPQRRRDDALDGAYPDASETRCGDGLCYPKGLSAVQRRAIGRLVSRLSADDAQAILDELTGRVERRTVSSPIGYCAGLVEAYRQGKFQPEVGPAIAERRAAARRGEAALADGVATSNEEMSARSCGIPASVREKLDRFRGKHRLQQADGACDDRQGNLCLAAERPTNDPP
jgi:hypothetical protein